MSITSSQDRLRISCLSKIDLLGKEMLVQFVNDTVSFYLKSLRVPFLSKYAEILKGVQNVVPVREAVVEIIMLAMRKTFGGSTLDVFKNAVA